MQGYTRLEYIQSDGNQWLDTGIKPSATLDISLDYEVLEVVQSANPIFGERKAWADGLSKIVIWINASYNFALNYGNYDSGYISGTNARKRNLYQITNGMFVVNGNVELDFEETEITETNNNLFLFALSTSSGVDNRNTRGRCYGLTIKDTSGTILNWVPVRRNSDNAVGMLDTLTNTFYENSGTGSFIAGLDNQFTRLKYLESTGTQRINLNIQSTEETGLQVTFENTDSAQTDKYPMGHGGNRLYAPNAPYNNYWAMGYRDFATGASEMQIVSTDTLPYMLNKVQTSINFFDNNKGVVKELSSGNVYEKALPTGRPFTYGTLNLFYTWSNWTGRIYEAQVSEGANIICNLVPCRRISDNVLGMCDTINNVFYTNVGTGEFIASPEWEYTVSGGVVSITKYIGAETLNIVLPPASAFGGTSIIFADGTYSDYVFQNVKYTMTTCVLNEDLTSIGDYAFYGCTSLTSITIPDSVTSIGGGAFEGCTSLTSITIPEGVTEIQSSAFYGCTSLTSITIPDSVTSIGYSAFSDCTSLTSITIPEGVTEIQSSAFYGCTSLTSITIPDSVTSIGYSAFSGCTSLTSITIPEGVTEIQSSAFYRCTSLTSITIPEGVTEIQSSAFYGCTSLTSITIPDSVTSIGYSAFSGCTSLTSITIPEGVTEIQSSAFYRCTSLTSITIPEGVTEIQSSAFYRCTSLTSIKVLGTTPPTLGSNAFYNTNSCPIYVPAQSLETYKTATNWVEYESRMDILTRLDWIFTVGNSVVSITKYIGAETLNIVLPPASAFGGTSIIFADGTYSDYVFQIVNYTMTTCVLNEDLTSIGDYAFYRCTSLSSITIPDSVTSIGGGAFEGCTSLTSITIPDSVTSIGGGAFEGCTSLTSITIPDSVTSIGGGAFEGCTSLTSITIPEGVTEIQSSAFYGCTSLTSITIPDSVTSIGYSAFYGCTSLTSIKVLGTTPPTLRSEAFDNTNNCPIYVLGRSLETYKTATNWVVYAPRMDILAKLDWTFTVDENVVNITKYIGEEKQSIIVPPAEDFLGTTIVFKAGSYEEYCFKDVATTMNSITFNDDVTRLEAWIFRACKFLGVINLPRNLEYFTPVAFWDCTGILSFSISSENTVFETLNSVLYRKGREFLVMYPANRNTTAFSTLAETTSIGGYAFLYAQKLERIQFPNIRVFNYGSIYYCPNLEIVNFGANTTTIAGETISNSPKMKYISCDNPIPPSLASQCFEYTNGCVIRVPVGSVQDYKTATNWSSFNSRILAVANCVIRHNGTPVYDLRYDGTECKQCLLDGNLVYRNKLIFEGEDFFEGTDDGAEYYKTYPLKQSGASVKVYYKKSPTGDLLNVTLLPNETKEVTTWFERGKIEIKNLKYDQLFVYCANGWGTSRNLYIMKIEQAEE